MNDSTFKDYLENRYYDQLKYYNAASAKNKKKYRQFQWIVIILAASTPILAALDEKIFFIAGKHWKLDIQILVVVVSAIVAILTTGLKTFNYQELWTSYRSTQEQLKPEIYYYSLGIGLYAEPDVNKEKLFVSRVESILDKEHKSWPPAQKLKELTAAEQQGEVPTDLSSNGTNPANSATDPSSTDSQDPANNDNNSNASSEESKNK